MFKQDKGQVTFPCGCESISLTVTTATAAATTNFNATLTQVSFLEALFSPLSLSLPCTSTCTCTCTCTCTSTCTSTCTCTCTSTCTQTHTNTQSLLVAGVLIEVERKILVFTNQIVRRVVCVESNNIYEVCLSSGLFGVKTIPLTQTHTSLNLCE